MANVTVTVLEADGSTETDVEVLGLGRQAASASKSLTLSTEDKAVLDAVAASVDGVEGKLDTLHTDLATTLAAYVDGLETLVGATNTALAAGTTTIAKAEDAAHSSGDVGVMMLAVRRDSITSGAADGDYVTLNIDANGRLYVASVAAGDVAHDAADSGSPVKNGNKATTSLSGLTLVSNGDRTDQFAGVDGVQIVRPHCNLEDIVSNVATCTAGANTSIISAQGAGVKFYLTSAIIRNGGSSNGNCIITDGSGGTTKADIPFPASTGAIFNPPVPIPFSANTAVYADPSGSDNIIVTLIGFKSKV